MPRRPSFFDWTLLASALICLHSVAEVTAQEAETPDWDITSPRGDTPRVIRFTTDEGTWMSVDVSPDGGVIAMDLLGEIWLLPIEGGEARPITRESGMALDYHPAFSPDGSRIAFISDRSGQDNVWVMDADGGNARQVSDQRENRMFLPAWTPDGQFIVAQVGGDSNLRGRAELWMYHVDGGSGVLLTAPDMNASWPEVGPDGRHLYFEERLPLTGDPDPTRGLYQLRRMDLATGQILPITSGVGPVRDGGGGRRSSGGGVAPAVSPDGRWLAFGRRLATGNYRISGHEYGPRTALWLRDLATGADRMVLDPITPDLQERNNGGPLPRHAWMPDGESIILTEGGKLKRLDVESGVVRTIEFTAAIEETISEIVDAPVRVAEGPLDVRMIRWPTASPDGRTLAFQALGRIWLQDLPSGEARRLTPESFGPHEYSPAWSPDGGWLAFATWSDSAAGAVWKVPSGGGSPQRLTELAGFFLNPAWSPDGRTLVVAKGTGSMLRGMLASDEAWFSLVSLPASGGAAREIAQVFGGGGGIMPGHVVAPEFGPDGRVFYVQTAQQGGGVVLRSVNIEGSDVRSHMVIRGSDQAAPSPDGRWVAFQRGANMHLAPLPWPGAGASPLELGLSDGKLPVQRLSQEGGVYPNWVDATTLEWGSANRYFRRDVATERTDSFDIDLSVPRRTSTGTIAFTGARIVTMDGDEVIPAGDVVVTDGRIVAIGGSGDVDIPTSARRMDVTGHTIIPGLMDTHIHMAREARGVISERSWELAANLAYGLTSGLEPYAWSESVFSAIEDVEAGVQVGPRMYSTGEGLNAGITAQHGKVESPEDAHAEVQRLASYGARSIKQYWQPRRNQRQWLVEAARAAGLMVTSEGDTDHLSAIGLTMDGHTGFEHPILNLPLYRDVSEFLGQAGVFYSGTLVVGGAGPWGEEYFYQESDIWDDEKLRRFTPWRWLEPHTRRHMYRPATDYPFPIHAQGAADIIAAGGHATIGAHGQLQGLGSHFEIWMYASAMTPMEALRTATIFPAQMIGVDQDTGSLEVGKLADLLVLTRNPLDDIRNTTAIRYVMKGGILYEAETLDEIWPETNAFGDFVWRQEGMRR